MRAVVAHAAKDIRVEESPVPALGPRDLRVRIAFGGICGSDLHYFSHGGFGTVRLREPMILGHEVAGVVEAVGAEVRSVHVGARIAVNPSRPCNRCRYCLEGKQNHCLEMRFYGSAMRFPHVQGAFRETLVCDEAQAEPVADGVSLGEAAMAEPLAVALHAARRAGALLGKRVLVTGAGPIGALCVIAARRAGAAEIVVTDIAEATLRARAPRRGRRDRQCRRRAAAARRIRRRQGAFRRAVRGLGGGSRGPFGARGRQARRGDGPAWARRRNDAADQHDHRQGTRNARDLPLPSRSSRLRSN